MIAMSGLLNAKQVQIEDEPVVTERLLVPTLVSKYFAE